MKAGDACLLSAGNLLKNPMRTLLTILGLGVGVAAVLTVITLGAAGQDQVEKEISKLGVDKVWITAEQGSGERLKKDSAGKIASVTGAAASGTATTAAPVIFGKTAQLTTVTGYDEGAWEVLSPTLLEGRFFTGGEYKDGAPVAVIDETLAEILDAEVLGRYVALGSRKVRVIGVVRPVAAQASSGMLILPLETLLDTYTDAGVTEITVNVPGDQSAETVAAIAMEVLGDGYQAVTLQEEIDAARSVIRIFMLVLASVAVVCMMTGGIGVMNILLVSVRERRREIGLMKAVGGTSVQVAALFLLEAACYALLGDLLGLALGVGLIRFFGRMIGLNAVLSLSTAVPALWGAALLGILFGVGPAVKASCMLPVEALRQE